jgi:Ser-tRNA(Ala) deacylase AlaX
MPVRKIFWEDPYRTELPAHVTGVDGARVTLDQTIAYAFAGGQQSDSGAIGGYEILEARKDGLEIYYTLSEGHGLQPGEAVLVTIDWGKRYRLMKLHFAAELVLELVYQGYGHPEKIGADITANKARVDFYWKGNISLILPELHTRFKELVDADLDIVSAFSDEVAERRTWHIAGFATVACGGTHLKRTGEIGPVTFKRNNIGKDKERIEIYPDDRD